MRLAEFAKQYGNFTVPTFQVLVAGVDLVRELLLSVPSAEVDLKQKASGRFSFKVTNAFNWEERTFVGGKGERTLDLLELFAYGTPLKFAWLHRSFKIKNLDQRDYYRSEHGL